MSEIDAVAEAIYQPWMDADKATMRRIAKDAIQAYKSAKTPRTISASFDYQRVKEWALDPNRKGAVLSFTSGIERDVAYLIEDLDYTNFKNQSRTISAEEFERFANAIRFMPNVWEKDTENTAKAALKTLGITVREE
jgi:hypothetical protein